MYELAQAVEGRGRLLPRALVRMLGRDLVDESFLSSAMCASFRPLRLPTSSQRAQSQTASFSTYCFCTRDRVSAIGREGLGDSFELQLRYMLAKFVFVSVYHILRSVMIHVVT